MQDRYRKWHELFALIGHELTLEDYTVPNSKNHVIYVSDTSINSSFVAISITGSQWDLLYWINRLSDEPKSFEAFVTEFVAKMYFDTRNKKSE